MAGLTAEGKDLICTAANSVISGCSHKFKNAAGVVMAILSSITMVLDTVNHRLKNSGNYTGSVTVAGTITQVDITNGTNVVIANCTYGLASDNAQFTGSSKDLNANDLLSESDGAMTVTFT